MPSFMWTLWTVKRQDHPKRLGGHGPIGALQRGLIPAKFRGSDSQGQEASEPEHPHCA